MEALNLANAQMVDLMQIVGAMGGMPSRTGNAEAGGAGFTALFQQLLQGLGEDAGVPDSTAWMQDVFDLASGSKKKTDKWEMLMELLAMMPGQLDFRQFALTDPESGMPQELGAMVELDMMNAFGPWFTLADALALLGETIPEEAFDDLLADAGDGRDALGISTLFEDLPAKPPDVAIAKPTTAEAKPARAPDTYYGETTLRMDDGSEMPVTVLGYVDTDKGSGEEAFLGQEQFRQAVQAAKVKLSGKDPKDEALAREILLGENVKRIQPNSMFAANAAQVEEPGIPEQIMNGLSQNLRAGKGEFVLKLVPEGLGEITVKLLAREGKTTLRIITASAETARLINNDLQALQNALRPIQVEVREAIPQAEEGSETGAYYAGFDQFNQFNQYRNQGEPSQGTNRRRGRMEADEGDEILVGGVTEAAMAAAVLPESDLDMYV